MSQFYFQNGAVAGTVKEFVDILNQAGDDVFIYHCNKEKNDFYTWLLDVHPDAAKAIRRIKTRKGMVKKLQAM